MPWQLPQTFPILKNNHIHLWCASLGRNQKESAPLSKLLNSQEKARAEKFVTKEAKNSFIIARGILRFLLANYLQTDPRDLSFQQNHYGKIYLESSPLQFNISHSNDLALFAFTMNQPIGVDIEFIRDGFDFISIAQRFFSEKENQALSALPKNQQLSAFFNCWSRKEAFIKALGKGIFCNPRNFSVEVSDKKNGKLIIQSSDNNLDVKNWTLEAFEPSPGYAGAFAISANSYQTKYYHLDSIGDKT